MGVLWSRLSTEGYYVSLDKQLGSIKQSISTLEAGKRRRQQAWANVRARFVAGFFAVYIVILSYAAYVTQQPAGAYSSVAHAKRISPVFLAPAMAWLVYSVADYLRAVLDRRATTQTEKLQAKLRKMVAELKDSTRFQRTQAILEKYDPDRPPPPPPALSSKQQQQQQRRKTNGGNANRAANVAATAVTGAGMALSSALGQIFSTAAGTLIADEPMMVAMLKDAQSKAQELERENEELRRRLGMPPGLVLGGGGGTTSMNNNFRAPPPTLVVGDGGGGGANEMVEDENLGGFGSPLPLSAEETVGAAAVFESPRVLSPLEREIGQPAAAVVEEELNLTK